MDSSNDRFSSNIEPINNLLDLLLDIDSSQDSSVSTQAESYTVKIAESKKATEEEKVKPEVNPQDNGSNHHDREVEIEAPQPDPTPEETKEDEAFLGQTKTAKTKSSPAIEVSESKPLEQYESALAIDPESASPSELVDSVNTIIPLVVELLKYKIDDSKEVIFEAVAPIVERLIERRSAEEPEKMAVAIAQILPSAITKKIHLDPETIARAIAPELALSIKEQIRLDEHAISEALGSEMGKAIKTQIEVEKDAMVDALYPVIGDTISKYMVEVVKEINHKVENTISPDGLKRKIQARIKGVSEAELILQESVGCHIQAVFLIDKDSGIIIEKIQKQGEQELDSDMVAGMLTAIRSFANDCIVSDSELDTIDYGNWQIHLEVAGYCYLAVVLRGEPTKDFLDKIRSTFGEIVLHHGEAIEKFEGDVATVPPQIKPKLEQLMQPTTLPNNRRSTKSSFTLLWLIAFLLFIVLIPWGWISYRHQISRKIEQSTAIQLDAAPELSVYRLDPKVEQQTLIVTGRVPNQELRSKANAIAFDIAEQNNLELDNQIITVDLPVNFDSIPGEIQRLTNLFNQQPGVSIESNYQSRALSISGFILERSQQQNIARAFEQIPGIEKIIFNTASQLPTIEEKIYFEIGSSSLNLTDSSIKIESVRQFLSQYPQLNLKLIAYSDGQGSDAINQKLAQERCSNIKSALIAQGFEPDRLVANCKLDRPTKRDDLRSQPTRYVAFEPFIPTQESP